MASAEANARLAGVQVAVVQENSDSKMEYLQQAWRFGAENWAYLTGAATALACLATFIKSIWEYKKENSLKRFEKYQAITREWNQNAETQEIIRLLDEKQESLRDYDVKTKQDFIDRYEDVAVMYESGLMRRSIAFYMFGYYAIRCNDSEEFWTGLETNSAYHSLFRRFAKEMKQIDRDIARKRDDLGKWKFKF
jgi:hypothetical protein